LQLYVVGDIIGLLKKKGDFNMEAIAKFSAEELKKAREELHRELDKGIRDMEMGDVISHDELMKAIKTKYGLWDV